MARDEQTRSTDGGWPQVQRTDGSGAGATTASAEGLVQPDGYVYDAQGYAHPVYGGFVYDDDGNAYPLESLVAESPATGQQPAVPVASTPSDPFTFDRYAAVDPSTQWAFEDGAVEPPHARKARRQRRSLVALAVSLALFLGVGYYVYTEVLPSFRPAAPTQTQAADDFPGPGTGTVEVVVEAGATGAEIGAALEEAGVVKSVAAFTRAYAANPDAVSIQHGTYAMQLEMSGAGAVDWLLNRDNKIELRVTIVEGHTVEQILKTIASKTQISLEDLEAAADKPRKLGVPKGAKKQLEGWIFPATYVVEPGDDAEAVLTKMVSQMRTELSRLEVPEDEWETVLIKASLIEREINRDEDRPKAARVIETRLEKGITLGIDATLAYGLGKSGFELTDSELRSDHPYNTRTQQGLPPTAIGAPGLKAIKAVLDPAEGPWEYWVTINPTTGETVFSETYAEHQEHKKLFEQWLAENGDAESSDEDG